MSETKIFKAIDLNLKNLIEELRKWFTEQKFNTQILKTEDDKTLIQIEKTGNWRKVAGQSTALNIILSQNNEELTVDIGTGRWIDKVASGAVSLLILWPLALSAAFGAWQQMNMNDKIFEYISNFISSNCKKEQNNT